MNGIWKGFVTPHAIGALFFALAGTAGLFFGMLSETGWLSLVGLSLGAWGVGTVAASKQHPTQNPMTGEWNGKQRRRGD